MWDLLARQEPALEIMKLDKVADGLLIYGARSTSSDRPGGTLSIIHRQLSVIRVDQQEQISWRHAYSSLPDAHEVFATGTTPNGHSCVVYGEQRRGEELLNPVLLQLDPKGKIVWARREITGSRHTGARASLEQVANLDTIQVSATPDDGCLLVFVSRLLTQTTETYQLHFIQHRADGSEMWRESVPTQLYGRTFLLNDESARRYIIVQTNQSRDAAIAAMVQGVSFNPQTDVIGLSYRGKVLYHSPLTQNLEAVWVKGAVSGHDGSILLAGKSGSAWMGYLNANGKVLRQGMGLGREFSAVAADESGGYVFTGDGAVVVTDAKLQPLLTTEIGDTVVRRSVNKYLAARIPADMPVEQIIPWKTNQYLLLYKLGSKLLKVTVPAHGQHGG